MDATNETHFILIHNTKIGAIITMKRYNQQSINNTIGFPITRVKFKETCRKKKLRKTGKAPDDATSDAHALRDLLQESKSGHFPRLTGARGGQRPVERRKHTSGCVKMDVGC